MTVKNLYGDQWNACLVGFSPSEVRFLYWKPQCGDGGWEEYIIPFQTPSLLLKKKNRLFIHVGVLFYSCLKFLPYSLSLHIETIFANRGKLYILLPFYFQKIMYVSVERNLKWESVHHVSLPLTHWELVSSLENEVVGPEDL